MLKVNTKGMLYIYIFPYFGVEATTKCHDGRTDGHSGYYDNNGHN